MREESRIPVTGSSPTVESELSDTIERFPRKVVKGEEVS